MGFIERLFDEMAGENAAEEEKPLEIRYKPATERYKGTQDYDVSDAELRQFISATDSLIDMGFHFPLPVRRR